MATNGPTAELERALRSLQTVAFLSVRREDDATVAAAGAAHRPKPPHLNHKQSPPHFFCVSLRPAHQTHHCPLNVKWFFVLLNTKPETIPPSLREHGQRHAGASLCCPTIRQLVTRALATHSRLSRGSRPCPCRLPHVPPSGQVVSGC